MSKIINDDIKNIIGDKYLSYAISTIISRSLPDLRDGLKPVHRRIIYSMYELNLKSTSPYKKCARIVGDVMGKFHPHGDQAIYDSLVRMSQDFSIRYPLIEGQGNFGNIDGDNPAAMRYTEARLDLNANALLDGIDQNAVDFIDNYDGQNREPTVLPSLIPNILLNGSSGIAVGMATNIPSHNIQDVVNSLVELIKNPNLTINKLIKIINGPDLPTGGEILISKNELSNLYSKGRGSFIIKSRWKKIELSKGQYNIEIYEIPFQVSKTRIIENIANLVKNKKIPLDDVWDESDEKIRIILKPKNRNIQPSKLMELLFKVTDLSVKFHCNFNVLLDGKIPKTLGLKEILNKFIEHRRTIVKRVSKHKIDKIKSRVEILLGFLTAYKNLQKIINIIRKSKDPKKEIMKKFKLNERQSIAILEMRLRSLRMIEEKSVKDEIKTLKNEHKFLSSLINNKNKLNIYLIDQSKSYLNNIDKNNLERRSKIILDDNFENNTTSLDDFEEIENLTIICSVNDNLKIYKGHLSETDTGFDKNDKIKFILKIKSNDKLLFFTSDGKVFNLNPSILPGGKTKGSKFSFFVNLNHSSKIIKIIKYEKNLSCLIVSQFSKGFIYFIDEIPSVNKNGKQVFNLKNNDQIIKVLYPIKDKIALVSNNSKLLIFNSKEIPKLKRSSGVLMQRNKNNNLSDVITLNNNDELEWFNGKHLKKLSNYEFWLGKRSQVGKKIPRGFNKNLKFNN